MWLLRLSTERRCAFDIVKGAKKNGKKSSLSFVNLAMLYTLLRDVSRNEFSFFFLIRPLMRAFTLEKENFFSCYGDVTAASSNVISSPSPPLVLPCSAPFSLHFH